jgi:TonB-dependent starch-binding outer membrane protein SusC
MAGKACLRLAVLMSVLIGPSGLQAQERTTITGTVRSAAGDPISAARVAVTGTTTGALTDANGTYRLVVTGASGTIMLRAGAIGYGSSEAQVTLGAGPVTRDFTLAEQALTLDAVVVTGSPTGQATRREVPNTVSTIQTAEVVARNPAVMNLTSVLQSRVPGLQVMTQGGTEGVAPRVRIRGVSSVNAGSSPIYVIDGVRMNGGNLFGFSVSGATQSASDAIHPQDIESIEVIKGPAAATLYGADAANGVISITTKKGRPGQQSIRMNARTAYGEQEFTGRTFTNYTVCTQARIDQRFPATDALRPGQPVYPGCQGVAANGLISADILRQSPDALRTGHLRTYSLNATGGGERFGFYLSGNLDRNDGVVHNNEFQRISGRSNFVVAPSDKLDANVNVGFYRTDLRLPLSDNASNGLTRNANRGVPGRQNAFAVGWLGLSPAEINAYDNRTSTDRFLVSTVVRWQPFAWFQHRLAGGFDYNNRLNAVFYPRDPVGLAAGCGTGFCPYGPTAATGVRDQLRLTERLYTVDYAATVTNHFPRDFSSTLTFGSQLIASNFAYARGTSDGFAPGGVTLIGRGTTNTARDSLAEQRTVGFFIQETLGWRDRLFLTAGLRSDDNSAFGDEFSVEVFPKVGASYVISEEPFFNVPFVDQLRLRAAWGRAGNAPAPYSAERTFVPTVGVNSDNTPYQGLVTNSFGNPQLKAETGEEYELGFDGSLLNGRVAVDFTYFNKTMKDALIPVPAPHSGGFPGSVLQNVGTINNRGTELTVSVEPIRRTNFTWESRLAHGTLRNRFLSFGGVREDPIYQGFIVPGTGVILTPGRPLGTLFGTRPSIDPATGEYLRNPNGSLVVNRDTVFFGGALPTRTLSWENSFRIFRNFAVSAQLDHQGGHYQFNLTRRTRTFDGVARESILFPTSTRADTLAREILLSGAGAPYMERADFVKLREVAASYTFPARLSGRVGSDEVVFTLSGRNLRTWTDYTGSDPEVNAENTDFLLAETNAIPPTRRVTASVSVRF